MSRARIASALATGALALAPWAAPAPAQEAQPKGQDAPRFESRKALHEHYDAQILALDRRRIDDLTALAARLEGEEAEATYRELFNVAIAADRYEQAEGAAETYLKRKEMSSELRDLAGMIVVLADAERDDYDGATKAIDEFLARDHQPATAYALGEALLGRLIRAGKPDLAATVARRFIDLSKDAGVQAHYRARAGRLDAVGKPAPALAGTDVDGQEVSLAALKGKVVLVDFFATWAPPSVAAVPQFNRLRRQYRAKGFEVVGVSLDAARKQADRDEALSDVRHFLVDYRVGYPVLVNGAGDRDFARAYGVTEIPSTFLLDREGAVLAVELGPFELEKAIARALGVEEPAGPDPAGVVEPQPPKAAVPQPTGAGQTKAQAQPQPKAMTRPRPKR